MQIKRDSKAARAAKSRPWTGQPYARVQSGFRSNAKTHVRRRTHDYVHSDIHRKGRFRSRVTSPLERVFRVMTNAAEIDRSTDKAIKVLSERLMLLFVIIETWAPWPAEWISLREQAMAWMHFGCFAGSLSVRTTSAHAGGRQSWSRAQNPNSPDGPSGSSCGSLRVIFGGRPAALDQPFRLEEAGPVSGVHSRLCAGERTCPGGADMLVLSGDTANRSPDGCRCRKSDPHIMMMQSAEDRPRKNATDRLDGSG
jgi:hypothetical protein